MLLGVGAGGVDPVDFVKLNTAQGNGNDRTSFHYGSDGSIYYHSIANTWKAIKLDAAGEIVFQKVFSSHSAGTTYGMAVGYQDIQIYMGSTSGAYYNIWALNKSGALLWNKRWHIDHSSDTNAGSSFVDHGQGASLRALPNADIGLLLIEAPNVNNSSGSGENRAPIMLSFKMTDGTKIGWGGARSSQSGTVSNMSIRDWAVCLGSGATQGYFTMISGKSLKNETGWKNMHRIKGSFYTADHSGDKNIDFDSSATFLQSSGGHVDLQSANRGLDVLRDYSGTSIDSATLVVGNHAGAKIAYVNNSYHAGTWYDYAKNFNGTFIVTGCAKDPSDTNTIFISVQHEPSGQGYSNAVLTKITSNSLVWSRKFELVSTHSDFNANSGRMSLYPKDVIIHPSNGKGLLYVNPNGLPAFFCQFDTGSTAPSTGTYSLGTISGGTCTVVISSGPSDGTSSIGTPTTGTNTFTVMGDSDEYEPVTDSWTSGAVTDTSNVTYGGELWD